MMYLAYLAALVAAPQAAAPASSDAQVVAAIQELDAASNGLEAMQAEFGPLMRKAAAVARSSGDPVALARDIRPVLARYRTMLQAASARIAAIKPVTFSDDVPYSFARMQSESKAQVDGLLELTDALDAMMAALVAKNRAGVEAQFATIARSSVTLIHGQAVIMRRRQLAVPRDQSTHQSVGVAAGFYDAMVPIMAAMVNVKLTGEPSAARFARIATETRALVAAGRTNVARELTEIGDAPAAQQAALRTVFGLENDTFALGERLAAQLDALAAKPLTQEAARAAQTVMAEFENELSEIARRQIEAMPQAVGTGN